MDLKQAKQRLLARLENEGTLKTKSVIKAFESVPREEFMLPEYRDQSYADDAMPIISGQTISQPTTIAIMTEALELEKGQKVLEIGAGSGYQAAILSKIVGSEGKIYTIERLKDVYGLAKSALKNYKNVQIILGDGSLGYEAKAPYDRIIVTAMAPNVPKKLFEQLKEGGIMVLPVKQLMLKVKKVNERQITENLGYFSFVPLVGEFGY